MTSKSKNVQTVQQTIAQNEDVEYKVAKASDDLNRINAELADTAMHQAKGTENRALLFRE